MSKGKEIKNISQLLAFLGVVALIILFTFRRHPVDSEPTVVRKLVLGSLAKAELFSKNADIATDTLFNQLDKLDSLVNFYDTNSVLSRLNHSPADNKFPLNGLIYGLIESAFELAQSTDFDFNPAIGPLVELWQVGRKCEYVPQENEIVPLLPLVDIVYFEIADNQDLIKKQAGAMLDLGGIAKGYAVDLLSHRLELHGIDYLIDIGGTIKADAKDRRTWTIGVRHPREAGEVIASFELPNGYCCSTAGDYQQYFIKDGRRYHHILDPRSGYPTNNSLNSVTVIAPDGTSADALATALFVKGLEEAKNFIKKNCDYKAIFIFEKENKLYIKSSENIKINFFKP